MTLENVDEKVEFILNASHQPIVIVQLNGAIYESNEHFSKLVEHQTIENVKEILDEKFLQSFDDLLWKLPSQKTATSEFFIHLKSDKFYKVHVHLLYEEKMDRVIMLLSTSMTGRYERISEKRSNLEIEEIAASVAHEIRNPLTILKGFTHLLRAQSSGEMITYLNVIDDEIIRMEEILGEMLKVSKPRELRQMPIVLPLILDDMIRIINPKAIMHEVKIIQKNDYVDPPMIMGDECKLKQLLLNLIKNSFESMSAGGRLSLCLEVNERSQQATIIVTDTGKGIAKENVQQIFMPYFTTKSDGTGLGMPFVLRTVEEHGGTISIASEVGKGTSFIVTFPLCNENYSYM